MTKVFKKSFERKQKVAVLALCVVLAGSAISCTKSEIGGEVPYKHCLCDEEKPLAGFQFPIGEAYLFKDDVPEEMANQLNNDMYSAPFPKVCWIVYNNETDHAAINIGNLFYPEGGNIISVGTICNFPDFAKKWIISKNGCKVNFEGFIHEACNRSSFETANVVRIDYVLTNLKRK
jgi:hypothetical protein